MFWKFCISREIPILFALLLIYLSDESLEATQRQQDWDNVEKENDAEKLWKYIEETNKINTISQVAPSYQQNQLTHM
jgi:hypothetical protein